MTEGVWKSGNPPIRSVRELLHTLWTNAVGKPGYDKPLWQEFESQIEKLMEIHRAMVRLKETRTEDDERVLWDLFKKYRDQIKVDGNLKIDISSLTEPPPGLFGKNT